MDYTSLQLLALLRYLFLQIKLTVEYSVTKYSGAFYVGIADYLSCIFLNILERRNDFQLHPDQRGWATYSTLAVYETYRKK